MKTDKLEIVRFEDGQYGVRQTVMKPKDFLEWIGAFPYSKPTYSFTWAVLHCTEELNERPSFYAANDSLMEGNWLRGKLSDCKKKLAWILEMENPKVKPKIDVGVPISACDEMKL